MAEGHKPPCLVLRYGLCKVTGQYLLMGDQLSHPAAPSPAGPTGFMISTLSMFCIKECKMCSNMCQAYSMFSLSYQNVHA